MNEAEGIRLHMMGLYTREFFIIIERQRMQHNRRQRQNKSKT